MKLTQFILLCIFHFPRNSQHGQFMVVVGQRLLFLTQEKILMQICQNRLGKCGKVLPSMQRASSGDPWRSGTWGFGFISPHHVWNSWEIRSLLGNQPRYWQFWMKSNTNLNNQNLKSMKHVKIVLSLWHYFNVAVLIWAQRCSRNREISWFIDQSDRPWDLGWLGRHQHWQLVLGEK